MKVMTLKKIFLYHFTLKNCKEYKECPYKLYPISPVVNVFDILPHLLIYQSIYQPTVYTHTLIWKVFVAFIHIHNYSNVYFLKTRTFLLI